MILDLKEIVSVLEITKSFQRIKKLSYFHQRKGDLSIIAHLILETLNFEISHCAF